MRIQHILQCLTLASALIFSASCTEDGGKIGIIYDEENIINSYAEFGALSTTDTVGAVRNSGSSCYLGCIEDPETGDTIRASFATQFFSFENFAFPDHELMFPQDGTDHTGEPVSCDSVEVRLFFSAYTGDANNPMKLEVYALDPNKIIREDTAYFSDTDLMKQFVADGATPIATKTFAPLDYSLSDGELNSSTHNHNVRITLPKSIGSDIMNAYYADPENFRDSYSFIRNVCPGMYFRLRSGTGTMLTVSVSTLNISYTYYDKKDKKKLNGFCRFSATPEVMQCSQIERTYALEDLQANYPNCTFLKTPAGLCTEVTLPIDEISMNHKGDSISRASISFERFNPLDDDAAVKLGTPATLLMVRKNDVWEFFREHKVADGITSFTTAFSSTYNSYSFANIGPLISKCIQEKESGTTDEDWNKVLLIPVTVSTATDSNGATVQVSVEHDRSLNSARLVQGTTARPIPVKVIYSKFN